MSGIDYSKWDALSVSSSDEESPGQPVVSRFDAPVSVTFGDTSQPIAMSEQEREEGMNNEKVDVSRTRAEASGIDLVSNDSSVPQTASTRYDDSCSASLNTQSRLEGYVRNGGIYRPHYFWSQTLHHVKAYIELPANTRSKSLSVELVSKSLTIKLKRPEGTTHSTGDIPTKEEQTILAGSFPHPINDEEDEYDWEVKVLDLCWDTLEEIAGLDNRKPTATIPSEASSRSQQPIPGSFQTPAQHHQQMTLLELSLSKKREFEDVFVWWNCFLKGDTTIDVTQIPDRLNGKSKRNPRSSAIADRDASNANATESFQQVWKEAHAKFREKVKSGGFRKHEIPVSSSNERRDENGDAKSGES